MRHRIATVAVAVVLFMTAAAAASIELISTWTSPDAKPLAFAGRKVAAVVMVESLNLQMSAEEALAREISARGPVGVPSYRVVPREDLANKERVKGWFERAGIQGLVVIRVVDTDKEKVYSNVVWTSGYYGSAWDYYGYGWATPYPIGGARTQTTVTVETLLYDLSTATPIWAGVSRTTDPKNTGSFMQDLTKEVVKNLKKAGLTK